MYLKRKTISTIIVMVILISIIGFSYAKFMPVAVQGNNNINTILANTISGSSLISTFSVEFSNGEQIIDTNDIAPAYQYLSKFKVISSTNASQNIIVRLNTIINSATSGTYNLYSCNAQNYSTATLENVATNCSSVGSGTLPNSSTVIKVHTTNYLTVEANTTNYYILKIDTITNTKRYNGVVLVRSYYANSLENMIYEQYTPVSDAVASTYVTSETGINFQSVNSPTNGHGLYINDKNSGSGDIKYFRGGNYCTYPNYNVFQDSYCTSAGGTIGYLDLCSLHKSKNDCLASGYDYYELKNNVKFANFYWKIIRINADGSIRMIYNGNSTTNLRAFLGNWDTTSSISYGSSAVKTKTDAFYTTYLASYANYLADSSFCNDITLITVSGSSRYATYNRYISSAPTYNCPSSGIYSVAKGNLTYPIAAVNIDEVLYAGNQQSTRALYYMITIGQLSNNWWTMSPGVDGGYGITLGERSEIDVVSAVADEHEYRPVINIKGDTLVTENGSLDTPWEVQ